MAEPVDLRDEKFIPTKAAPDSTATNEATGDHHAVVQANTINGGVEQHHHEHQHLHATSGPVEPELVSGGPTPDEVAAAGEFFVERHGIDEAEWRLERRQVVLLSGNGNGWYIAALRLLDKRSPNGIAHLNPPRSLKEERNRNLKSGVGYVWHARQPFAEFDFTEVCGAVKKAGGWLVVLVQHPAEVPSASTGGSSRAPACGGRPRQRWCTGCRTDSDRRRSPWLTWSGSAAPGACSN
ncbi:hypothetical protein [Kutzneria kofuensis]|uniref:Uncharacterized protein n=1 Tax=Kutzneria kofuensis TaxID=103725 RepID=A0A7W9KSC4_9PSEU|nr:hypothetical protein [Kutzneria kofuensis]MBB5897528.1 hypothetical protein [Kutzneria kofuensis]